jgi:hypothetical protein
MNEAGEWETVDKVTYDVTFEGTFPDAKQVIAQGRIVGINTYEKRDGTTGVSIKVRAESVIPAVSDELPF